ncbi:hypothetical protein M404DRAFT_36330 [Pisolithus tinctorius Marx 270]|uniref:Uncharacterized protein n=1 Tax=Pisolithus tinctorius Marx 270 TaxID=870435 RepID=A0A0C3MW57_PISTI|nr:hypothetical protein M404DRAFT_36330 [Pisolithus tinctorius Marx 270]
MAAGRNFKEKIDNFLAMHNSIIASANLVSIQRPSQSSNSSRGHDTPPHLVSTMFFTNEESAEFQVDLHPSSYLIDEELESNANEEDQRALARAYAQVEELKNNIKKKATRFDSVEILAHCQRNPATSPAPANASSAPRPVVNSVPNDPVHVTENPTVSKTPAVSNPTDPRKSKPTTIPTPQFRYQSSFNEVAATRHLVNQVLEAKMEISTKDLLAVSPEIHKQVRELAATKKITIGSLETVSEAVASPTWASYEQFWVRDVEGKCVGLATAPLCAVDGILMDKLHVECILDSGCQVHDS